MKILSPVETSRCSRFVTLKDVAALAGVHQPVVSVVLNGAKSGTHVSDATRERVLRAADQLGYKRNGMAAQMKTGKFGSVALLLSTKASYSTLPPLTLSSIHEELVKRDYHLSLFQLSDEQLAHAVQTPKVLREWMADGIIVDYTHGIPAHLVEIIEAHQLPMIWLNTMRPVDCVRPDDFAAGQSAARHLLKLGHRRIGYIDTRSWEDPTQNAINHYSGHARLNGVRQVVGEAGAQLKVQMRHPGVMSRAKYDREVFGRLQQFLTEYRPSAVVVSSDIETVLTAALQVGLRVPQDLSIIACGVDETWFLGRETTSLSVPDLAIGKSAVQMLVQKISDPKHKIPTQVIPFLFSQGETCAPPAT